MHSRAIALIPFASLALAALVLGAGVASSFLPSESNCRKSTRVNWVTKTAWCKNPPTCVNECDVRPFTSGGEPVVTKKYCTCDLTAGDPTGAADCFMYLYQSGSVYLKPCTSSTSCPQSTPKCKPVDSTGNGTGWNCQCSTS